MKTQIRRPFLNSAISLVVFALVLLMPITLKSQNNNSPSNLEGTAWRGPDVPFSTSLGPAVTHVFYGFEKDGKMTSRAISGHVSQVQAIGEFQDPMFNPFGDKNPYRMKLYTPPVGIAVVDVPGTYKVDGNKLRIDFPKSFVNATIRGNEMTGVVTNRASGEKADWSVKKLEPKDRVEQ
ncbi:MAG TPA: hypothetical protein VKC61_21345 [Pyrinomonadaceae bacterium]|nr:hypothetical protein [Pyrinomonadaceae bacterium]